MYKNNERSLPMGVEAVHMRRTNLGKTNQASQIIMGRHYSIRLVLIAGWIHLKVIILTSNLSIA